MESRRPIHASACCVLFLICASSDGRQGEPKDAPSQIVFVNTSGQQALVKLTGEASQSVQMTDTETRDLKAAPGEYHVLVRYGNDPGQYRYLRSEQFTLPRDTVVPFVIHKLGRGNCLVYEATPDEFDKPSAIRKLKEAGTNSPDGTASKGLGELTGTVYSEETGEPSPRIRVVLAKKDPGRPACVLDSLRTAVSGPNGRFSVDSVPLGEWVLLYSRSRVVRKEWDGKRIQYPLDSYVRPSGPPPILGAIYHRNIADSLGDDSVVIPAGARVGFVNGQIVAPVHGYFESRELDLGLISFMAQLLSVTVGKAPQHIHVCVPTK